MALRVGLGKDSHRFLTSAELKAEDKDAGKPLIIGGVTIIGGTPFRAHSDGDVLYHAVFNAIASALGRRSIGHYFPDSDAAERNRDSADYLRAARELVASAGATIENISIVVECRTPRVDEITPEIQQNVAGLLGIDPSQISVTATSGEGVTPWGQGFGVEVIACVLLS